MLDPLPTPLASEPGGTDLSLVRQVRDGNERAASVLFRRYAARLQALVWRKFSPDLNCRVDADDIVQSVFRRFFEAARKGRYDAPSGEDLWELLVVITVNRVRSEKQFQRAARRDTRRTVETSGHPGLFGVASRDNAAETLFSLTVDEALRRLPDDYRRAVELRLEGYEIAEIAMAHGRSKRTIERVLHEARDLLRSCLNEDT